MSIRMEAGTTMTSLARTETGGHDTADLSPSVAARHACRSGMAHHPAGVAHRVVQRNLAMLAEKLRGAVHLFVLPNPIPYLITDTSDAVDSRVHATQPLINL